MTGEAARQNRTNSRGGCTKKSFRDGTRRGAKGEPLLRASSRSFADQVFRSAFFRHIVTGPAGPHAALADLDPPAGCAGKLAVRPVVAGGLVAGQGVGAFHRGGGRRDGHVALDAGQPLADEGRGVAAAGGGAGWRAGGSPAEAQAVPRNNAAAAPAIVPARRIRVRRSGHARLLLSCRGGGRRQGALSGRVLRPRRSGCRPDCSTSMRHRAGTIAGRSLHCGRVIVATVPGRTPGTVAGRGPRTRSGLYPLRIRRLRPAARLARRLLSTRSTSRAAPLHTPQKQDRGAVSDGADRAGRAVRAGGRTRGQWGRLLSYGKRDKSDASHASS